MTDLRAPSAVATVLATFPGAEIVDVIKLCETEEPNH
jgi:hypothetical protein